MGSGYRVFTAGEVLTASNVQNYLQDQAVMVFGGTAARSSAIGTANFEEGMLTYLTDVDKLQVYTGAAFADVYPAAATNQGLTLINTTSFSGVSSQSINDVFSATYTNYLVIVNVDLSVSSQELNIRLRVGGADNSSANYVWQKGNVNQASAAGGQSSGNSAAATLWNAASISGTHTVFTKIEFFNPFATENTSFYAQSHYFDSYANQATLFAGGSTTVTTSYTGFTLIPTSGNITGTARIYGYNQ